MAYQVVYIKYENTCLYGELIQTMEERRTCWLRPLSLCIDAGEDTATSVHNLSNGPDIICPHHLVQPALDTDWVPLAATMAEAQEPCNFSEANQYLRQFLQSLLG